MEEEKNPKSNGEGHMQGPLDGRDCMIVIYILVENTGKELRKRKLERETNQSQQLRHEEPIQNVSSSFFLFFASFFKVRSEIPTRH